MSVVPVFGREELLDAAQALLYLRDVERVTETEPAGRAEPCAVVGDYLVGMGQVGKGASGIFEFRKHIKCALGAPEVEAELAHAAYDEIASLSPDLKVVRGVGSRRRERGVGSRRRERGERHHLPHDAC